jgi:hypothetical protein
VTLGCRASVEALAPHKLDWHVDVFLIEPLRSALYGILKKAKQI